MNPINYIRSAIKRAYAWTSHWSTTPHALRALALLSAAEAVIFPIPPDPLLMAITLNDGRKKHWIKYASITLVASIFGGLVGYYFGVALFESVGQWIIDTFHLQQEYEDLGRRFQESSVLAVFTAALTPIPYKLITISSGAFNVKLIDFIIGSILGRGLRFYTVAFLTATLGKRHKDKIEKYIDVLSLAIVAAVIIIVLLTR